MCCTFLVYRCLDSYQSTGQVDRQKERNKNINKDKRRERRTDYPTERSTNRQLARQPNRPTDMITDIHADRPTDIRRDTHTDRRTQCPHKKKKTRQAIHSISHASNLSASHISFITRSDTDDGGHTTAEWRRGGWA